MNPQITNILELIMLMVITLGRYASGVYIAYLLIPSSLPNGWKIFLLLVLFLIVYGVNIEYSNPNKPTKPS